MKFYHACLLFELYCFWDLRGCAHTAVVCTVPIDALSVLCFLNAIILIRRKHVLNISVLSFMLEGSSK